jgi:hypothetical protein
MVVACYLQFEYDKRESRGEGIITGISMYSGAIHDNRLRIISWSLPCHPEMMIPLAGGLLTLPVLPEWIANPRPGTILRDRYETDIFTPEAPAHCHLENHLKYRR